MADFMKVDMSRLGQAEGRSADSGMAAPSGADVDTFQQAMRRRPLDERQGSGGDESDGGRGASHAPGEDTSAEAEALSSMFSRMTGPLDTLFAGRTAQTAETAAPSGDAPDLGALAEKLVERILVSGPDGGHEIRLTLGKDVLPGTEIRLQRGSDGVLSVHLATDNAASFQTLVGAQESLKARLESFEKDVRVEVVSERGGPEAENGDGRRQSRGEYVAPDERDAGARRTGRDAAPAV